MIAATSILESIGRTPVVRLRHLVSAQTAEVLVKLEWFNPTGSYKDRMALAMIEGAEKRGTLKPGMRVCEFTGGSTARRWRWCARRRDTASSPSRRTHSPRKN